MCSRFTQVTPGSVNSEFPWCQQKNETSDGRVLQCLELGFFKTAIKTRLQLVLEPWQSQDLVIALALTVNFGYLL